MAERDDWPYLDAAITPELLAEVARLERQGLDEATAAELLAERFRERLLRALAGDVPDFPPEG
jgi:hypothetical protein